MSTRGRPKRIRESIVRTASPPLFSAAELIGMRLHSILDHSSTAGPVRVYKTDTIANLPCPKAQRRSIAAILATKYQDANNSLRWYAERARRQELCDTHVTEIFRILGNVKKCQYRAT